VCYSCEKITLRGWPFPCRAERGLRVGSANIRNLSSRPRKNPHLRTGDAGCFYAHADQWPPGPHPSSPPSLRSERNHRGNAQAGLLASGSTYSLRLPSLAASGSWSFRFRSQQRRLQRTLTAFPCPERRKRFCQYALPYTENESPVNGCLGSFIFLCPWLSCPRWTSCTVFVREPFRR